MSSEDQDIKNLKNIAKSEKKKINRKKEFDKRKFVLLSLVFLAIAVFIIINSSKINSTPKPEKNVEGVNTKNSDPVKEIKGVVIEQMQTIQEEAKKIDLGEVATSSPQVQKIINDIKSLQDYPSDQAKSLCEQVCKGL